LRSRCATASALASALPVADRARPLALEAVLRARVLLERAREPEERADVERFD
jgi:hypothetical protein